MELFATGTVLCGCPDARGVPLWEDYLMGIVVQSTRVEKCVTILWETRKNAVEYLFGVDDATLSKGRQWWAKVGAWVRSEEDDNSSVHVTPLRNAKAVLAAV